MQAAAESSFDDMRHRCNCNRKSLQPRHLRCLGLFSPHVKLNQIAVKLQSNWARRAEAPQGRGMRVPLITNCQSCCYRNTVPIGSLLLQCCRLLHTHTHARARRSCCWMRRRLQGLLGGCAISHRALWLGFECRAGSNHRLSSSHYRLFLRV